MIIFLPGIVARSEVGGGALGQLVRKVQVSYDDPPRWDRRGIATLAAALGFLVATIVMLWPLPARAGSAVQDLGDPLFEIWVMRAVQHQIVTDPLNLYHANAFHPFKWSLAYSEEAISSALLAWPVYIVSGNDVLAYNWVLISSFWLMGFATFLLARELGARPGAAFLAGMIVAFIPARYAHLSHLHLLVFGWLPLTLWAMTRFVRTGQRRYGILTSVVLAVQLFASLHLAVYSTLALGLFVLLILFSGRGREWPRGSTLLWLAGIIIVPYLLFAPTLIPHLQAGDTYGFERTREEVERFSATPLEYRSVFVTNHFLSRWLPTHPTAFFPGFIALLGIACLAFKRRWQWPVAFAALLAIGSIILSLGFSLEIDGRSITMPYAWIYDYFPPIRNIRAVDRYGLLAMLGIGLLAAFGFSAIWNRVRGRLGTRAPVVGLVLTALLAVLVGIELRSGVGTAEVPNEPENVAVYDWLATQPEGPVVEFPSEPISGAPFLPIEYLYHSTRHWNPVIASYSGYVPPAHFSILNRLDATDDAPSMPTEENIGVLQDLNVRYVLIHRADGYDWRTAVDAAEDHPELRRRAEPGNSFVYELLPSEREPVKLGNRSFIPEAPAGAEMNMPLELNNPNPNQAVARLHGPAEETVEITWEQVDGDGSRSETVEVRIPFIVGPGRTPIPVQTTTPDTPGNYDLRVSLPDPYTEIVERVTIHPPVEDLYDDLPDDREIDVALESVTLDPRTDDGSPVLGVQATWYTLDTPDVDLSATVQIFGENDELVTQVDMQVQSVLGPTSEWEPGTRIVSTFSLPIPEDLVPGNYRMLLALYDASDPELRRTTLLLPEGSTATEYWLDDIEIAPE